MRKIVKVLNNFLNKLNKEKIIIFKNDATGDLIHVGMQFITL